MNLKIKKIRLKEEEKDIIFFITAIIFFIILTFFGIFSMTYTVKDIPAYRKICIEGYQYYQNDKSLIIKLDDNGKPVKCKDVK